MRFMICSGRLAVPVLSKAFAGVSAFALATTIIAAPATAQDTDPRTAAAATLKAELDVQKAMFDVESAKADLAAKRATALTSAIPASGMTAEAKLGDKAATSESFLLASRAVQNAGAQIAIKLKDIAALVIVPSDAELSLTHWRLFQLRRQLVDDLLTEANKAYVPPSHGKAVVTAMPLAGVVAVAQAIGAAAKIGSFFGSSYELAGQKFDPNEDMLAQAVANEWLAGGTFKPLVAKDLPSGRTEGAKANSPGVTFTSGTVHILKLVNDPLMVGYFTCELSALDKLGAKAAGNLAQATEAGKAARAATPPNLPLAERFEADAGRLDAALDTYKSFIADLTGANEKTALPITSVAQERLLEDATRQGASLLAVQAFGMNGGVYSQTNLWTWLGTSLPFKASGSAVAGYRLTDMTGQVTAVGQVDYRTAYTAINKIP